jgi:archaellin
VRPQPSASLRGDERGVTPAGAGLLIGAFGLAAAIFGAAMVGGGYAGGEQLEQTFYEALDRTTRGVELRGPVHVRTDGASVTEILLDVGVFPGSSGVSLDADATSDRTVVSYSDEDVLLNDVPYTVDWITGDGDTLLEAGELAQIVVDGGALPAIGKHDRFSVTIRPADGVPLTVERTMPPGNPLDLVVRLW